MEATVRFETNDMRVIENIKESNGQKLQGLDGIIYRYQYF